jgi:hypothetical protein
MALQQLLNPIEVMPIGDDRDYIELPKSTFTDFSKNMLRGIIRSNINRSLDRLHSNNYEINLEHN